MGTLSQELGSAGPEAIVLREVRKSYTEAGRRKEILRGIDAGIRRGEIVVLLGRSGSGKSTLLNLLGGLDAPDEGTVVVAGENLGALDERRRTLFRRRRLGFVFQFFNLVPTLTVIENVQLRPELNGMRGAAARTRALALLREVGLEDRAEASPDRLSGGEQQRVAIAAALAHEPEILLADEPTGNLDLETGRRVIELLDRLTRQAGRTLVMATHSPDVMGVADRVLAIENGLLVERAGGERR